jgi:hypothetical protein
MNSICNYWRGPLGGRHPSIPKMSEKETSSNPKVWTHAKKKNQFYTLCVFCRTDNRCILLLSFNSFSDNFLLRWMSDPRNAVRTNGRTNERTDGRTDGHFIVEHWKDVCTLNLHKSPLATHRETSGANVNETDLISPIIWTGPPSLSLLHTLFAHLLKEDWKNSEREIERVCVCVLIKETGA